MVIRALEYYDVFEPLNGAFDALIRQVGLFPYADPTKLGVRDQIAYEYHRPIGFELDGKEIVFHREQAEVYRGLMNGESFVLSAPTSFGKSLIIDALLASGKFDTFVIIVPTISLIDETRRRLSKFRDRYKVITHPSQESSDRNIYVLTQERAIDRDDLKSIDLLVIDEFYKLDIVGPDDGGRAAMLNHALYKLQKISKQIYLLGPSIQGIPEGFGERFKCTFMRTDFNTVVSEVHFIDKRPTREEAFLGLVKDLCEPTLVYCKSPAQANKVVELLSQTDVGYEDDVLNAVADWVAQAFHPDWSLRAALRQGVGIHHGRVPRALAHLNVKLFNEGKIRYLVCTSSLIEGVNTAAKNVVIYEGRLAKSRLDFFTFQNIRGRSGRMFQHFIGRVFVLDAPPEHQLELIDIPVFTQGDETPLGLLVQVEDDDLSERSRQRLQPVAHQQELPFSLLRENAHIDPELQINVALRLREGGSALNRRLAWTGMPGWENLQAVCGIIFDEFVQKPINGVFSGPQLAFRLNELRNADSVQSFICSILDKDKYVKTADGAVEAAFLFQRNWASFAVPRYLHALDLIQKHVYATMGMPRGDYSVYAGQVENLFLEPEITALEEYGIPIQVSVKLRDRLVLGKGLDQAIASVAGLSLDGGELSLFETRMLEDARTAI